jgi:hypothetical protein
MYQLGLLILLVYCTFRELIRALGCEGLIGMFFHDGPRPGHGT